MTRFLALHRATVILAATLLTLGVSGCWNPFDPRIASDRAIAPPPPLPISPAGALELFRWCWQNRAIAEYREIFTDDYSFQFSERDSAGNEFRDRPWRREDELTAADNLFSKGTANDPPATSITLDYTQSLVAYPDDRENKTYPWHQQIRSQVLLRVNRGENGFEVKGAALFYLVRGDSAKLPDELLNRGFQPDSNRWYIERWVDETLQDQSPALALERAGTAGARSVRPANLTPPLPVTWGRLKAVYLR